MRKLLSERRVPEKQVVPATMLVNSSQRVSSSLLSRNHCSFKPPTRCKTVIKDLNKWGCVT